MTGEILPLEEDLLNELRRYELKNEVGIPATAPLGEPESR